jgi:hypothetical protein
MGLWATVIEVGLGLQHNRVDLHSLTVQSIYRMQSSDNLDYIVISEIGSASDDSLAQRSSLNF